MRVNVLAVLFFFSITAGCFEPGRATFSLVLELREEVYDRGPPIYVTSIVARLRNTGAAEGFVDAGCFKLRVAVDAAPGPDARNCSGSPNRSNATALRVGATQEEAIHFATRGDSKARPAGSYVATAGVHVWPDDEMLSKRLTFHWDGTKASPT